MAPSAKTCSPAKAISDPGTVLQLSALVGAIAVAPNRALAQLQALLPWTPDLTAQLVGRAVALDLIGRGPEGGFALLDRGRLLLIEGHASARPSIASPTGTRRPVADTLRQRAWTAMQLSGRFTVGSLAVLAARPEDRHAIRTLHRYTRALLAAGYLVVLPARAASAATGAAAPRQWRLARDTGPHAPVLRKQGTVFFDPNLGDHVPLRKQAADEGQGAALSDPQNAPSGEARDAA